MTVEKYALDDRYRPQFLQDIVGQDRVRDTLLIALRDQKISPVYLFCGPRGTGKTTAARALGKALNCLNFEAPTIAPCGECMSCKGTGIGNFTDFEEINAGDHNGVDAARALIERVALTPMKGRFKILLLDECHMLSASAWNSLLKTLEKPPSHVVFILATTDPQKLLSTTVSRAQRFDFVRIDEKEIHAQLRKVATLENLEITDQALEFIAAHANGGMRDALKALEVATLGDGLIDIDQVAAALPAPLSLQIGGLLEVVAAQDLLAILMRAQALIEQDKKEPRSIVQGLIGAFRDLMVLNLDAKAAVCTRSGIDVEVLQPYAQKWSFLAISNGLKVLQETETYLRTLGQADTGTLWLEVALMGLMKGVGIPAELEKSPVMPSPSANLAASVKVKTMQPTAMAATVPLSQLNQDEAESDRRELTWSKLYDLASANGKALMDQSALVGYVNGVATIAADASVVSQMRPLKKGLEKLLHRVTGDNVSVEFQVKAEIAA